MTLRPSLCRRTFVAILLFGFLTITLLNPSGFIPTYQITEVTSLYNMSELAESDYSNLIDMKDFEFTLNSCPCDLKNTSLLILVHSAPDNSERRQVIRDTWAKQSNSIKLIFLVAGVDNEQVQDKLYFEHQSYGDLVQGNFFDTYRNLSYKHVMAMKWAIYHCPEAKHVLKMDDDTFVNMPYLFRYLSKFNDSDTTMSCRVCSKCVSQRKKESKYYLTIKEYSPKFFPTYCYGFAIIYTPKVIFELYKEAQRSKYFWIDDAWITGILAEKVNLTHKDIKNLIMTQDQMKKFVKSHKNYQPFLFGPIQLTVDNMMKLWKTIKQVNQSSWN